MAYSLNFLTGASRVRRLITIASLSAAVAAPVPAQTFRTLHSFLGGNTGANPQTGLLLSDNSLYGTAYFLTAGPLSYAGGAVFSIHTDGSDFTTLHTFSEVGYYSTNSGGAGPLAGLTLLNNTLYGTGCLGGSTGAGTAFSLHTDGSAFSVLHTFEAGPAGTNEGRGPEGTLILSGQTLYGTTVADGVSGGGTLFSMKTDGSELTVLHSFVYTEGTRPDGVVLSGGTLYGVTSVNGPRGYGTVFSITTNGTGFMNLHAFGGGSDGGFPFGTLVIGSNMLYGTTSGAGSSGNGTVFCVKTDGSQFTTLHTFSVNATNYSVAGADGASPYSGLVLSGSTLYGTAVGGGASGDGTVFCLKTDGSGFTVLHSFDNNDGSTPYGGLILSGNTLYGTTLAGGDLGYGTVFAISLAPRLTITSAGSDIVLTWPTNYAGFDYTSYILQSSTALGPSAIWTTNLPARIVVRGQNTVTTPVSGTQRFFRLNKQ